LPVSFSRDFIAKSDNIGLPVERAGRRYRMQRSRISPLSAAALLLALFPAVAGAAPLKQPEGEVILTISGAVKNANGDNGAEFDAQMLARLPQQTITTNTPWHDGPVKFEGPYLRDIMKAAGASGEIAVVTALDDYSVEMPFADFTDRKPILAMKRDGEIMEPDDQGPLFIIYNYDGDETLATDEFYERSVWSVRRIEVK
jgi:hypothetical protein